LIEKIALNFFCWIGITVCVFFLLAVTIVILNLIQNTWQRRKWIVMEQKLREELSHIDRWCACYPQVVATCRRIKQFVDGDLGCDICSISEFRDRLPGDGLPKLKG